jgi:hypothetical protein
MEDIIITPATYTGKDFFLLPTEQQKYPEAADPILILQRMAMIHTFL